MQKILERDSKKIYITPDFALFGVVVLFVFFSTVSIVVMHGQGIAQSVEDLFDQ